MRAAASHILKVPRLVSKILISFAFFGVVLLSPARAADEGPACRPSPAADHTAASIYADEDPEEALPPDEAAPGEDEGRWHPTDETLSPFDSDDDDEMQA